MPSIPYIMQKNINHGNYYVVATFRTQQQTNEHLGKLLYSILSPIRLLREKTQEEKPSIRINLRNTTAGFHITALPPGYSTLCKLQHGSPLWHLLFQLQFHLSQYCHLLNIKYCINIHYICTHTHTHIYINFITWSQSTTHTCYVHYITPQNQTPDNNFFNF